MELVQSGIHALGEIPWGSHFCNFYQGQKDLVDTLVPYFKAGLENHELCLWVTSEPLLAHQARTLLKNLVPNLADLEAIGQIEIINHSDWYLRTGQNDADATLKLWVDRQKRALELGYKGLRLTGNTYWLEREDWAAFTEYEAKVNACFAQHRIIGLCSYCIEKTGSMEVFDVVRNHDFALLRQDGDWELLETASVKKSKNELQKLNSDLKSNLKSARNAAESANRLKTEFLANISHEIRTPLGAILGFADLLMEEDLSKDERQDFVSTIQRNGVSLSRLVDDILDIAKIEADRLEIQKLYFPLKPLVQEVTALFGPSTRAQETSIRTEFGSDVPVTFYCDPARLRQILVNLLGNAVKFTHQGEVVLRVEKVSGNDGQDLLFTIADSGIGISSEAQPHLFQAFKQADGSMSRRYGGTGLGLYLSHKLANALGGNVYLVASELGKGSTFAAQMPFDSISAKVPPAERTQASSEDKTLENFRILVAEDVSDNRRLIGRLLKATGATIDFAVDGEEAIAKQSSGTYDLVLMDLQMPRLDGFAAMKKLRSSGFHKPIVALSAHAMVEERLKSINAGFDDYLTKPIDRVELIRVLGQYKNRLQIALAD